MDLFLLYAAMQAQQQQRSMGGGDSTGNVPHREYDAAAGWHFYDDVSGIDCSNNGTQAASLQSRDATVCCAEVFRVPASPPVSIRFRVLRRGDAGSTIGFGILGSRAIEHGSRTVGEVEMTDSVGLLEVRTETLILCQDKIYARYGVNVQAGTEITIRVDGHSLTFQKDNQEFACQNLTNTRLNGVFRFGASLCSPGQNVSIVPCTDDRRNHNTLASFFESLALPTESYSPQNGFHFVDVLTNVDTKNDDRTAYSTGPVRGTIYTREVFSVPASKPVSVAFRLRNTADALLVFGLLSADQSQATKYLLGEKSLHDSFGLLMLRKQLGVMVNDQKRCSWSTAGDFSSGTTVVLTISGCALAVTVNGQSLEEECLKSLSLSGPCRFGLSFTAAGQEAELIPPSSVVPSSSSSSTAAQPAAAAPPTHKLNEAVYREDEGWSWVAEGPSQPILTDSSASAKSTAADQHAYTSQVLAFNANSRITCDGCGAGGRNGADGRCGALFTTRHQCCSCEQSYDYCNRCFFATDNAALHPHPKSNFAVIHGGTFFSITVRVVDCKGAGLSFGITPSSARGLADKSSIAVCSAGSSLHVLVGGQRVQTLPHKPFSDGDTVSIRLQNSTFVLSVNGVTVDKEVLSPSAASLKYRFAARFFAPQQQLRILAVRPLAVGMACEVVAIDATLAAEVAICGTGTEKGVKQGTLLAFDNRDNTVKLACHERMQGAWVPRAVVREVSNTDRPKLLLPLRPGMLVLRHVDWQWGPVDGFPSPVEAGRVLEVNGKRAKVHFTKGVVEVRYGGQYFDVIATVERGHRVARNIFFWDLGNQDGGGYGLVTAIEGTQFSVRWDSDPATNYRYRFGDCVYQIQRIDEAAASDAPSVEEADTLPKDCLVVLKSLQARPELNGQRARVSRFVDGRYRVTLESGSNAEISVRAENVERVNVSNVVRDDSKNNNNSSATTNNNSSSSNYTTSHHVDPTNMLPVGSLVTIQNLINRADLNNQAGKIAALDGGRYTVVVESSNTTISLKPENVRLQTSTTTTVVNNDSSSPSTVLPSQPVPGMQLGKDGEQMVSEEIMASKKIERESFTYLGKELLGSGTFGRVCRGIYCETPVAIKWIVDNEGTGTASDALREVLFGALLSHPNILSISNWAEQEINGASSYYLIMPLVEPGSLRKVLESLPAAAPQHGGKLGWEKFFKIASGVANALNYMMTRKPAVVHRDLKPDNILVNQTFIAQLTDFGLAKRLATQQSKAIHRTKSGACGTQVYMSLEALCGNSTTPKSDAYSFGCVLWEMLHGDAPRKECITPTELHTAVVTKQEPLAIDAKLPAGIASLLRDLTLHYANDRPTPKDIVARLDAERKKFQNKEYAALL